MINYVCSRGLIMLVAVLGLAGCSSPTSPAERGIARAGDTAEKVLRTMGEPDERRNEATGGGQSVWIYKNHIQQPERQKQTGWSEVLAPAVHDQNENVVHEEVTRDIPRTQAGEVIQVTLRRGVVSAVEALKR